MSNAEPQPILPSSLPILSRLDWTGMTANRKVGKWGGEYLASYTLDFTTENKNRCSLELRPKDELLGAFLAIRVGSDYPIKLAFEKRADGGVIVTRRIA